MAEPKTVHALHSIEVEVIGTCTPGTCSVVSGPASAWKEGEAEEVEIEMIQYGSMEVIFRKPADQDLETPQIEDPGLRLELHEAIIEQYRRDKDTHREHSQSSASDWGEFDD